MLSRANLRVVPPVARVIEVDAPSPTPEALLARLFAEEQRLEHELLKVRNLLRFERNRFAAVEKLLVPPRMELLRTRFAPPKKPCRGDD